MIIIKSNADLEIMRQACKISARALQIGGEMVKPGVTTAQIDKAVHDYIISQNAHPSFLGYGGFPASVCISINEVVIHGIPGMRKLIEGDVVSIDVGAQYKGFHGDNAATFPVGKISQEAAKLLKVTEECLYLAIEQAKTGNRIGDVSHVIQAHAENNSFGVVKKYVGHGIGKDLHEDPQVPNYGPAGRGPRLDVGMAIAIEPMINCGGADIEVLDDDWTVVTLDKSISAHFEHTIAITENGAEILTRAG